MKKGTVPFFLHIGQFLEASHPDTRKLLKNDKLQIDQGSKILEIDAVYASGVGCHP